MCLNVGVGENTTDSKKNKKQPYKMKEQIK